MKKPADKGDTDIRVQETIERGFALLGLSTEESRRTLARLGDADTIGTAPAQMPSLKLSSSTGSQKNA